MIARRATNSSPEEVAGSSSWQIPYLGTGTWADFNSSELWYRYIRRTPSSGDWHPPLYRYLCTYQQTSPLTKQANYHRTRHTCFLQSADREQHLHQPEIVTALFFRSNTRFDRVQTIIDAECLSNLSVVMRWLLDILRVLVMKKRRSARPHSLQDIE